jgi:hypothetical protein
MAIHVTSSRQQIPQMLLPLGGTPLIFRNVSRNPGIQGVVRRCLLPVSNDGIIE